jgi:hypothetical protein
VSNLPDNTPRHRLALRPALVRAAVSPAAAVATAAGAGIGALDHSAVLAVVLAAVGWTGRMLAAVVAGRRRARAALPHPAELDPWSVPEPWRQLLHQALAAQTRFDQVVHGWPPGPTRDRLEDLRPRVYAEVAELGTLARRGAAAVGWTGATYTAGSPTAGQLGAELERLRIERTRLGAPSERADELTRREEALAAQLRAAHRSREVSDEIQDRLRQAVARLDQTVTELLALGAAEGDSGGVAGAVDELSDGVSSLRAALTETSGSPPNPGTP